MEEWMFWAVGACVVLWVLGRPLIFLMFPSSGTATWLDKYTSDEPMKTGDRGGLFLSDSSSGDGGCGGGD